MRKRDFKTVVIVAAVLVALGLLGKHKVFVGVGFALFTVGLISPKSAGLFAQVWGKIGEALGWVNSRVLMGLLFLLVFVPFSLLLRPFDKSVLRESLRRKTGPKRSYWMIREETLRAESLRKPW